MIDSVENEVEMLERHLEMLLMVIKTEPIGIVKMANESDYARHEVRYSLRKLEEANLIEPSQQGAVTTAQTTPFIENLDGQIDEIRMQVTAMKSNE